MNDDPRLPPPHPEADWPHAPAHQLVGSGVFMVTAGTYRKEPYFADGPRLRMLQSAILEIAAVHGWALEAWAAFPNHYHFVAASPPEAGSLKTVVGELHSRTGVALNRHDRTPGRKVWHNYWETRLTRESSYLARLNYVHQNPVRHGLVAVANQYPYGSAAWLERSVSAARVRTIYSLKIDRVNVPDDF